MNDIIAPKPAPLDAPLVITPEMLAAATAFQRKNPPIFTPEQEQLLCNFYCSRPRAERLAMRQRSDYLRAEIGWELVTCDLAAYFNAWETDGSPTGPFAPADD